MTNKQGDDFLNACRAGEYDKGEKNSLPKDSDAKHR